MRLGTNRSCWWPEGGGRNSLQRRAARRNSRAWSRARTASAVFVASGLRGSSSMTRNLADVSMLARPRRGRAAVSGRQEWFENLVNRFWYDERIEVLPLVGSCSDPESVL